MKRATNKKIMYAQDTSVSVERSQAELRKILNKYGCGRFMIADDPDKATMMFEVKNRAIRFDLPLPRRDAYATRIVRGKEVAQTPDRQYADWEQACRAKWRALLLCVKAKLEAVEVGITTFEQEFLAHFVLPGGRVFGDLAIPALLKGGTPDMKSLLQLPEK